MHEIPLLINIGVALAAALVGGLLAITTALGLGLIGDPAHVAAAETLVSGAKRDA